MFMNISWEFFDKWWNNEFERVCSYADSHILFQKNNTKEY